MAYKIIKENKRSMFIALFVAIVLTVGVLIARYNSYIHAFFWHCIEGNYAYVEGHKIQLPILWWAEKDSSSYDTLLLVRANPSTNLFPPRIDIRPILRGSPSDTDQELLESTQRLVAAINQQHGMSASLVILRTKKLTLYCTKENIIVSRFTLGSIFSCNASGLKYSFAYYGFPKNEKEAESILSSMQ